MIKIGVISDTHISDKKECLPPAVLEAFKNVEMIIHAGDITDPCVIESLKKVCPNVIAIKGNMDTDQSGGNLQEKEIIKIGKYNIGIMHGYGHPAGLIELLKKSFADKKVDIILFGHSHQPFNEKIGDILFFNPGSPTDKVFAPYNSYGILQINDKIEAEIVRI